MSYCTQANMINEIGENELIQLTDRNNLGVIDAVVLAKALANADAKINSYLTHYVLPLSIIPANFELMACDIARFYLFKDAVPDVVKARFADAIKYLEQVSAKKIVLSADATGASSEVAPSIAGVDYIQVAPDNFGRCGY